MSKKRIVPIVRGLYDATLDALRRADRLGTEGGAEVEIEGVILREADGTLGLALDARTPSLGSVPAEVGGGIHRSRSDRVQDAARFRVRFWFGDRAGLDELAITDLDLKTTDLDGLRDEIEALRAEVARLMLIETAEEGHGP